MKYIVLQVKEDGITREIPIIFPNGLVHSEVFDAITCHIGIDAKPISAGEISLFGLKLNCHGDSESLKVDSRDEKDNTLINMIDYTGGMS